MAECGVGSGECGTSVGAVLQVAAWGGADSREGMDSCSPFG